jgi:PAS domain S-box-containing protein
MVVQWDVQPSEDGVRSVAARDIVEHAPDAVLLVDGRGSIVLVNAQAEAMFGYSREELQGQLIEVLVPEHLRERHIWHRTRYAAEHHVRPMGVGLDLSGRRKDGSLFPVEISLSPIQSADRPLIICAVRDATERRKVREELQRQADTLGEQGRLLDLAHDAILVRDLGRIVTFWNDGATSLYGWPRDEALGRRVDELLKAEYPRRIEEIEAEVLGTGRWEGTLVHSRRDGTRLMIASRWDLRRDDHGRPVAILEINSDVTDHKRSEESLQARVRQQAAVAELGRQALSDLDLGHLMDEAASLVARSLEADFSNILELLPDRTSLLLRAGTGWTEGLVGQATLTGDVRLPASYALLAQEPVIVEDLPSDARFGGASILHEHRVISGVSTVIPGRSGTYGALGVFTSRRRRFNQDDLYFLQSVASVLALAIDRKRREQEQRERDLLRADQLAMVGQMAAGVAHELRNPLTSIKGLVQVNLREAKSRGLPAEDLRVIEQEIRRMERTLQTFLDFARAPRCECRRLSLLPLIEQTLALIRGRTEKQDVALRFVQPATCMFVDGDSDQIQQLLVNLALNALDAMPQGGILELEIRLPHGGQVEIEISDSGPGIAPSLLPYVFDPFVSGKEKGLGLGLAISRRIAEDHGGSLEASTRLEGGARFVLRLPAFPA